MKDADRNVRWTTANALGKIGSPKAVQALTAALEDPDEIVRQHASASLRIITKTAAPIGDNAPTLDKLINALSAKDIFNFEKTIQQAVPDIGEDATLKTLETALTRRVSGQWLGANELEQFKDTAAAEIFAIALCKNDDLNRFTALSTLARIGTKRAFPTLINLLNDKTDDGHGWNVRTRTNVVYALGKIGSKDDSAQLQATYALQSALKDPDATVRKEAAEALSRTLFERAEKEAKQGHLKEASKYYHEFLKNAPPQWSGYIETAKARLQELDKKMS